MKIFRDDNKNIVSIMAGSNDIIGHKKQEDIIKENENKLKHYTTFLKPLFGGENYHGKVTTIRPIIIDKTWGREEIIHNDTHCLKIMTLIPGYEVSNHWHSKKQESFILISGKLIIESTDQRGNITKTKLTKPLESFTLDINVPHTFYCPDEQKEDTIFLEASTTDDSRDSYRIRPSRTRT
jgi:mannose-6-phosphate isomerase-like protein (cupin superfamily)